MEIQTKKLRMGSEREYMESIKTAKAAKDLAGTIFGNKTFMANQTMLTYAMTLTKVKEKEEESLVWFNKAEELFDEINDNVSFKEGCNLLFNMLLHYNFMVNDFGYSLDNQKRKELINKLQAQITHGNNNQVLLKKALVSIQETFIEIDQNACLLKLERLFQEVDSP